LATFYSFPAQKASDECPAVPRSVRIHAESLHEATVKLRDALTADPELKKEHPEFEKEPEKEKPKKLK
jgi:GrpB-like predicted nucleotidyltransferase (UPF0157 family)